MGLSLRECLACFKTSNPSFSTKTSKQAERIKGVLVTALVIGIIAVGLGLFYKFGFTHLSSLGLHLGSQPHTAVWIAMVAGGGGVSTLAVAGLLRPKKRIGYQPIRTEETFWEKMQRLLPCFKNQID